MQKIEPDFGSFRNSAGSIFYFEDNVLRVLDSEGDNKTIKLTFDILMKEDKELNKFVSAITNVAEVSEVALVAAKSDIDY